MHRESARPAVHPSNEEEPDRRQANTSTSACQSGVFGRHLQHRREGSIQCSYARLSQCLRVEVTDGISVELNFVEDLSGLAEGDGGNRGEFSHVFRILSRLRQVCLHHKLLEYGREQK
jgi:hypothetical protein